MLAVRDYRDINQKGSSIKEHIVPHLKFLESIVDSNGFIQYRTRYYDLISIDYNWS